MFKEREDYKYLPNVFSNGVSFPVYVPPYFNPNKPVNSKGEIIENPNRLTLEEAVSQFNKLLENSQQQHTEIIEPIPVEDQTEEDKSLEAIFNAKENYYDETGENCHIFTDKELGTYKTYFDDIVSAVSEGCKQAGENRPIINLFFININKK